MVQESIQKNMSEEVDFESLLMRRESKEKLQDSKWSKAIIKDVSIYNGYKYVLSRDKNSDGESTVTHIVSSGSPREVYRKYQCDIGNTDDMFVSKRNTEFTSSLTKSFKLGTEEYSYKSKNKILITLSSPNGDYEDIFELTIKPTTTEGIEYAYVRLYDKIGDSISVGKPIARSNLDIRLNKVYQSSKSKIIIDDLVRKMSIIGIPLLILYFGKDIIGIIMNSIVNTSFEFILFTIISYMMLLATAALSGIAISSYSHDGWYSIKKSDDIVQLYTDYGGQFDHGDSIPIRVSKYKNTELGDDMFLSDCSKWILKSNTL
jgi:hypothetical protein